MIRASAFYILCVGAIAGGIGLAIGNAVGICAAPGIAMLLLASGGCGAAGTLFLLRRSCTALCTQLASESALFAPNKSDLPATGFFFLNRMIRELSDAAGRAVNDAVLRSRELEIRLKLATAEREHAEAILHGISDAVLVTDAFDELILANESAARMFDFPLSEAPRRPLDQVLHDARMISLIREMRLSRGARRVVEHQVGLGQNTRKFKVTLAGVSNAPLAGDGPRHAPSAEAAAPSGVVAVLHDVTHECEVSQMKNDFVSMVSHELRTPLASIRAYIEMLIDGEADDEKTRREFHEVIQNEANRLGRLIDNILNISRIEAGLVRVDKQPLSLAVVAKDAIEVIAPQARQKQITIEESCAPVSYQTLADRDMIYQAVLNLLSNAIKYTPEGGSVAVCIAANEEKRRISLRIRDTGVGIAPKDLPRVFDKFFRAESNSRMAPGTGLGLSLVKHIIETVHQGQMLVESELAKGSCFGFELELCE